MKTKESLIVAAMAISMFSIIYLTAPPNSKSFKIPNPKSEHRKVPDRLEQASHRKKENTNKLSVINIEECNCNRWWDYYGIIIKCKTFHLQGLKQLPRPRVPDQPPVSQHLLRPLTQAGPGPEGRGLLLLRARRQVAEWADQVGQHRGVTLHWGDPDQHRATEGVLSRWCRMSYFIIKIHTGLF